jgi:hypothetical protein
MKTNKLSKLTLVAIGGLMISQVSIATPTLVPFKTVLPNGTVIEWTTIDGTCHIGTTCYIGVKPATGSGGMNAKCIDLVDRGHCPLHLFTAYVCSMRVGPTFQFGLFANKLQFAKNGVPTKPILNMNCQITNL